MFVSSYYVQSVLLAISLHTSEHSFTFIGPQQVTYWTTITYKPYIGPAITFRLMFSIKLYVLCCTFATPSFLCSPAVATTVTV